MTAARQSPAGRPAFRPFGHRGGQLSGSPPCDSKRPGGSPFQADPRCPDRHQRAHLYQRRGLGIQQRRPGQVKPEPGLVPGEAFIDDRQPAQNLLEADRPVHTVTSLPETPTASQASAKVPTAQSSPAGVTAASHQGINRRESQHAGDGGAKSYLWGDVPPSVALRGYEPLEEELAYFSTCSFRSRLVRGGRWQPNALPLGKLRMRRWAGWL
jgi:hypothetical protein